MSVAISGDRTVVKKEAVKNKDLTAHVECKHKSYPNNN